ncbi:MAG: hypothetical protein Q4C66_07055 [Lachnospiraceae bacterium]|nr:hypothetical protein [Lachnospiraceae bacterium]
MRKIGKELAVFATLGIMAFAVPFAAYADEDDEWEYEEEWEDEEDEDYEEDDDDEENEEKGWFQDSKGNWRYKYEYGVYHDRIEEIDGKEYYFDSYGIMATNMLVRTPNTGFGSCYYYFGADGSKVTGWVQEKDGSWLYATPVNGEILWRGIVYDAGLYYIIDGYEMVTGVYNMEWDKDKYYDANATDWPYEKKFPHKIGWGYVDAGASGGIAYEQLPVSNGMTQEYYNKLLEQYTNTNSSGSQTNSASQFAISDRYVGTAMAQHGYYSYELISREYTQAAVLGGFSAVYKVRVQQAGSYHTGYLRITVNANGGYVSSSF